MTLGEYRVGISFNPSANKQVDLIKRTAADFIDLLCDNVAAADDSSVEAQAAKFRELCGEIDVAGVPERQRLVDIAVECIMDAEGEDLENAKILIEDAAMWAVKAATKGPME